MKNDKRKDERKRKMSVISFSVPGKIKETYGLLRDLSAGGMQISFNMILEIGERIDFLQAESLPCSYGHVRWCHKRDELYLIGIEFAVGLRTGVSSSFNSAEQK